jgi:hypothetical protein
MRKPSGVTLELISSDIKLPPWFDILAVAGIVLGGPIIYSIGDIIMRAIASGKSLMTAKITAGIPCLKRTYTKELPTSF